MTSGSLKKMLNGLDPLNGLYDLLRRSQNTEEDLDDTLPTPDSAHNPLTVSSSVSLSSKISNTPTIETIEDSLPPSPQVGLPVNFAEVAPGIYRSSFPQSTNFEHLAELKLKTILTLVSEDYSNQYLEFIDSHGINHFQIMIPPNKQPFVAIPLESMTKALSLILDPRNHPILVHCNKGKHRTGCVIGCYRKMCDWDVEDVITEYRLYASHKARALDEKYITGFNQEEMVARLNDIAYHEAKEKAVPFPTPPASEKYVDGEQ